MRQKYKRKTLYWTSNTEQKLDQIAKKFSRRKKKPSESEIVRAAIRIVSPAAIFQELTLE